LEVLIPIAMKIIWTFIFLLYTVLVLGQRTANVPPYAQKKSNWCWAACVEMIAKYYNTNFINQHSLAIQDNNRKSRSNAGCGINSQTCDFVYRKYNNSCNYTVNLNELLNILSSNNFSCSLETTQNYLPNYLPAIAVINTSLDSCNSTRHATVCIKTNGNSFDVIDPHDAPCIKDTVTYTLSNNTPEFVCHWIVDIIPRTTGIANEKQNNIKFTSYQPESRIGEINNDISPEALVQLCSSGLYTCVPVKYIDNNKLRSDSLVSSNLKDYLLPQDIIELIYNKPPFTKNSFVYSKEKILWEPYMIRYDKTNIAEAWNKRLTINFGSDLLNFLKGILFSKKIKSKKLQVINNPKQQNLDALLFKNTYKREKLIRFHHLDQDFILYENQDGKGNTVLEPVQNYKNYYPGPDKKCRNWVYSEAKVVKDLKQLLLTVE
jgi:hypothetical protein